MSIFIFISFIFTLNSMHLPSLFIVSKSVQNRANIKNIYIKSDVSIIDDDNELLFTLKEDLFFNGNTKTINILLRKSSGVFFNTTKSIRQSKNPFYHSLFLSDFANYMYNVLNIDFDRTNIYFRRTPDKTYISPDDVRIVLFNKIPVYAVGRGPNKALFGIKNFELLSLKTALYNIEFSNYKSYFNASVLFPNTIRFSTSKLTAIYTVRKVLINTKHPVSTKNYSKYIDSDLNRYISLFR